MQGRGAPCRGGKRRAGPGRSTLPAAGYPGAGQVAGQGVARAYQRRGPGRAAGYRGRRPGSGPPPPPCAPLPPARCPVPGSCGGAGRGRPLWHRRPPPPAPPPPPAARLPPRRSHPLAVWRCLRGVSPPECPTHACPLSCVPSTRVPPRAGRAWPRPACQEAPSRCLTPDPWGFGQRGGFPHPAITGSVQELRGSPLQRDRGRAPKSSLASPQHLSLASSL